MNPRYFLILLAGILNVTHAIAANDQTVNVDGKSVVISSWICASQKSEIPPGFFVAEIDADLNVCEYPKQHILIREINYSAFWMCNFDKIGVPAGYAITQTSTSATCGCRELAQAPNGKTYCATVGARDFLGWPMLSISKRYN